ncbi:tetratricopeptide repeat protein [Rubripirellula reticaptiva]|uniref:Uncharacterized protein n=1 Tax=Rubripirellula reticaptiva TaxID=2528013 RepID=A0A5C6ES58_9BACT|nr:hypothetical protein [Rubripirellula reticaptiva]TWU51842.1 hypothetical protein Poly59_34370 [Rubripirellula reticaptiva]
MNHRGQCPACHRVVEIESEDLPSSVRCDCGTKLIALCAASMAELPFHCDACGVSFVVEPGDVGDLITCDCGAKIEVLDAVMRAPMKAVERSDQFECGAAPRTANDPKLMGDSDPVSAKSNVDEEDLFREAKTSGRRTNWLPVAGMAAVIGFFLFSVGAFVLSRRANDLDDQNNKSRQPAATTKSTPPLADQKLDRRLLAKLLVEVPDPQTESSRGIESSNIASLVGSATDTKKRVSKDEIATRQRRSPYGGPVAKRNVQLPKAGLPRPRIEEVPVDRPRLALEAAYRDMFESYEVLGAFDEKEKADLSDDYRKTLGETLFLCRHAFQIAQAEKDQTKVNELTYLLAYLSYTAGQVIEASIYGEMAARWGSPRDAATREAAMIAIAACQEANACHWGIADKLGELDQQRMVAEIVQQRWPDNDQLDAIWMHLAQSYFAFGKPRLAAETFLKIKNGSDQFESAQLAAGNAYWSYFIDQASATDPAPKEMVSLLKLAEKHLRVAVTLMQQKKGASPTTNLVSAKLLLSKAAERLGKEGEALRWLEAGPMAVTRTITTESKKRRGKVQIDKRTADAVFDTLYRIKVSSGKWNEAYQSLVKLDAKSHPEIGSRYTAIAKGLIKNVEQTGTVSEAQVGLLRKLFDAVAKHDAERSDSMQVWVGQSWATVGTKADSDKLSNACLQNAERAFENAMNQPDFPESSRLTVTLLRADLFQRSGNPMASLEMIREVLKTSPNAVTLQVRAAKLLQEIAFEQDNVGGILEAINGPPKLPANGESSPIWGWVKVSNVLHQLSYSDNATDEHKTLSHEANYHLARCQWLLAKLTQDSSQRESQFRKLKSQLSRRITLSGTDPGQGDVWQVGLESLLEKIE